MIITPLNRVEVLRLLPKGLVTAEIGVYNGGFSAQIVSQSAPSKHHAIDPWGGDNDPYVVEYRIKDDMTERFKAVTQLFADHTAKGQVEIHRDYSYNVIPTFPNRYLDWVYIDGMHSYDAVKADLELVDSKVKDDGFIWGHDFSNTFMSRAKKFGVIPAVKEFIASRGYSLVLITNESAPSYLIVRDQHTEYAKTLRDKLLNASPRSIIIDSQLLDEFSQDEFIANDGKKHFLLRFDRKNR